MVALLFFLTGAIAFWPAGGTVYGLPPWLGAGLVVMVPPTAVLMALAVVFRPVRHCAEILAATMVFLVLIGALGSGRAASGEAQLLPRSAWTMLIFFLIYSIYAEKWIDRLLPKRRLTFHNHSVSRLPPARLWPALALTPETAHLDPDENRVLIEWIEPGKTLREVERISEIATVEEIQHIETSEPGSLIRHRYEAINVAPGALGASGTKTYRLRPHGSGSEVLAERVVDRTSRRAQIFEWVDDAFGRADDTRIERIERIERVGRA
ncbi:MAG: hypothetical protein ACK4GT_00905 [Pararhodobacter sp.]